MLVIFPHASPHPDAVRALKEVAPRAEWWDVSGSIFAYSQLVEKLWAEKRSFLLVEHDVELSARALRQALYCSCEWSISRYRGPWDGVGEPPLLDKSLGCTRFRSSLMEAIPDAVVRANQIDDAGTVCPPGDWKRLDCRLYSILRGAGDSLRSPHFHEEVVHHHLFDYGCSCGREHE